MADAPQPAPAEAPAGPSVASRVGRNSVFNLVRAAVTVPLAFALTPYMLHRLGDDRFGIWALVGVLTAYAQLCDLGIGLGLVKYVAEYAARGEQERISRLVSTAFAFYLAVAAAVGIGTYAALGWIVATALHVPPGLAVEAWQVFAMAMAVFCISLIFSVYNGVLTGLQRLDYVNVSGFVNYLVLSLGIVVALELGLGLTGMVIASAAGTLLTIGINAALARRLLPTLALHPIRLFDLPALKVILGYGSIVQVSGLANLLIMQVDRLLLSHFVSLGSVAVYEAGNRLVSQVRSLIVLMVTPLTPAASQLQVEARQDTIDRLYQRSFKYVASCCIPLFMLTAAVAQPLVTVWLGPSYGATAVTIQLLSLGFAVNLLTGPGHFMLLGLDRASYTMKASVVGGVINVACCLVLIPYLGYFGVVWGMVAALLISALYFFWLLHEVIRVPLWDTYGSALFKPLAAAALPALAVRLALALLPGGWLPLLALCAAFFPTYAALLFLFQHFDAGDRRALVAVLPQRLRPLVGAGR